MTRYVPERRTARWVAKDRFIVVGNPTFFGFSALISDLGSASSTWQAASGCVAIPFRVPQPIVIKQLAWGNGSAPGGNHDIGIYDASDNLIVAAGSTAGSGSLAWQFVNITDTVLTPGNYYIVKAEDDVTANRILISNLTAGTPLLDFIGVRESTADNFPLPATLVSMTAPTTFTRLPIVGMTARDPF